MDADKDRKRKKDKNRDDDARKEKKSKRARSRSREPDDAKDMDSRRKRKHSRSPSPAVKREKDDRKREGPKEAEVKKDVPERKPKDADMLNTRTGGAYIPPARLRMMQAQITDKSSMAYQRLAWEALKKSIHGHINKINVGNIGIIIKELLKENIVRGRGLLCRSVIQAQAASPTFTNVYAALVSAVNSRFPNIGELLLKRLVIQFKRGFKRNDKPTCISSASFIAHLVNQRVAHEILALELLTLLVETPTDDSVEVAIAFLKECGQKLTEVSSKGVNAIFEMLRNILHEGQLDKRVQYMIEVMFQVWKDGFKDHPALIDELELVPEEEQFTHLLMLDDATDPQDILNVYKHDEKYEENEEKYKTLSKEILGSDAESGDEDGSGESGEESDEEDENEEQKEVTIIDNTETNLVALRRTIYLTINSSLDFEECAHKLMKMQLKPGQEVELCHMFLDCCAEQRTYEKFYGLLAQRFCNINRIYIGPFEEIFKDSYSTAHRLDTNRLRNVSKFFAHLLFTDSISWEVLECVKLNEEDTTSSSRIYIKILFQELAEYMGLKKLNDRLKDPTLQEAFSGVFPRDNPKNTRFSINFFTSIGLGGLTDELREHLKQMPKNVPPAITEINVSSSSSSSSSDSESDSSTSSDSSSSDEEESNKEKRKKSKKDKNKDKTPKTPEEPNKDKPVERWGHDGFYDTYGQDARREPQPRDGDFVRPRDVPRRNDRRNDDDRSRRNGDRGDDRRNGDRGDDRRNDRHRQYEETRYQDRRDEGRRSERDDTDKRRDRDESRRYQGEREEVDRRSSRDDESRRYQDDRRNRRNDRDDRERSNRESETDVDRRHNRDDERRYESEDRRSERNTDKERRKTDDRNKNGDREDMYRSRKENDKDRRDGEVAGDRNKNNREDDSDKDSDSEEDSRKKKKKDRKKKKDDSSEEEEHRRKKKDKRSKYEKENIEKESRKKREERKYESDSESEDERSSKRRDQEEGWDIRRASSIRKETPDRYWDSYKVDTRTDPESRSKSDRRKDRSFLVGKKITENYNISEKQFLISLLTEAIDYAAQREFSALKLAALLTVYLATHLYFKWYFWSPPAAVWAYFKEIMIRHTIESKRMEMLIIQYTETAPFK
ncbi:hypothetical protein MSG28_001957 [Choristoneura fumiferana]|uniref:Uncharacterized protein n=1 Tax=Choristoneura fumiferana TaxID=7141 RepID=A0ACC0JTB1_CHOFU|nr:hypothetical protein MSG28_001957 [Choristoneura fumiferana]